MKTEREHLNLLPLLDLTSRTYSHTHTVSFSLSLSLSIYLALSLSLSLSHTYTNTSHTLARKQALILRRKSRVKELTLISIALKAH